MNEDIFNMSVRKYLKKVGVTAQREIEAAVRTAVAEGRIPGDASLPAVVVLQVEGVRLSVTIDGDLDLE